MSAVCLLLSLFFLCPVVAAQTCRNNIATSTPEGGFILNSDATAEQKTTGLTWMRCSIGQQWDGKTCTGTAARFSWSAALKAADEYEFAGHANWRLPNKNELESIVESRCFSPAIDAQVFPATPSDYFWTSSPYAGVAYGIWSVSFDYGIVNASIKTGGIHVRLVRDAE